MDRGKDEREWVRKKGRRLSGGKAERNSWGSYGKRCLRGERE